MSLTHLTQFLSRVRSGYLFLPSVMAAVGVILGFSMAEVDRRAADGAFGDWSGMFNMEVSDARAILSGIAASAITVAGVVFSITMVVLAAVSSQFGPRLLPNFIKQESTKFVMGGFIGTFIYCTVAIAEVSTRNDDRSLPQFSTLVGLLLGIGSFLLLILFIHRVALFIQAPRVIDDVATRLVHAMEHLFPGGSGEAQRCVAGAPESWRPAEFSTAPRRIGVGRDGYLQALDAETLLRLATKHDLVIRVHRRPGQFIFANDPVIDVWPDHRVNDRLARKLGKQLYLGPERTDTQDAEFAVEQLVEVAVRALSPGINDPFTAINCIDRLGGALAFLATRALPSPLRYDAHGRLRLVAQPDTYSGILDAAFNPLRQHAKREESVAIRLMAILARLAERPAPDEFRRSLKKHAVLLEECVIEGGMQATDKGDFERRFRAAMGAIADEPEAPEDGRNGSEG